MSIFFKGNDDTKKSAVIDLTAAPKVKIHIIKCSSSSVFSPYMDAIKLKDLRQIPPISLPFPASRVAHSAN